jgi:AcrR family transcriptional regulator
VRKVPQQARSRVMVERIVAAGRTVLVHDGYDAFSTNRVATAAEVSPGSLYQYFPDKGAILDEVIDRWAAEVSVRVTDCLSAPLLGVDGGDPLPRVMSALVDALEADAPMLRVVMEQLPAARDRPRHLALEQRVREIATAYLAAIAPARRTAMPRHTWVLVIAIEHVAVRWVLDQPASISRDDVVGELVRLTRAYLAELGISAT